MNDWFLVNAGQDLARTEQALSRHDYVALQNIVHQLKGSAMIFRMTPTVSAALPIESVLNTGSPVDHVELVEACIALHQQIAALENALTLR